MAADMEVIKEIPGYKVILKAIIKSQIQQLVEQLASTTEEESVILTASVTDGTLSHLGSDSAKGFLEDHEEVKSQFLGFCLKKHHRKKQEEKEKAEAEALQLKQMSSPSRYGGVPRFQPPGVQGQVHPISIIRASPSHGMNVRHEPYPMARPSPGRRRSGGQNLNMSGSVPSSPSQPLIKQEADESNDSTSNAGDNDDDNSNAGQSDSAQEGGLTDPTSAGADNSDSANIDPNVNVKLEAITEGEMELEITGVEPGRQLIPQDTSSWDPNVSMATNYDPNMAAGGSMMQADAQSLEPRPSTSTEDKVLYHPCNFCSKKFKSPSHLAVHSRSHEGERPFVCNICDRGFKTKGTLKSHMVVHVNKDDKESTSRTSLSKKSQLSPSGSKSKECTPKKSPSKGHKCSICNKVYKTLSHLATHSRIHAGERPYMCKICGLGFKQPVTLRTHMIVHVKMDVINKPTNS